jgi:hypothetical protein
MLVDGLPTAFGLHGLRCNRTAGSVKACGRIGDPTAEGYRAQGMWPFVCGLLHNHHTLEIDPRKHQEGGGKILPNRPSVGTGGAPGIENRVNAR